MKRILITGGAGFIGSHLSEKLLNDGNDIICLDNFFTGSKDNIRHLIGNNRFELVRHDIINEYLAEVDEIYNLACPASPVHYQYNPIKTMKTSVIGIINIQRSNFISYGSVGYLGTVWFSSEVSQPLNVPTVNVIGFKGAVGSRTLSLVNSALKS